MKYKTIRVKETTHQKVKVEAAKSGMQIKDFVDNLIDTYINNKKQQEE